LAHQQQDQPMPPKIKPQMILRAQSRLQRQGSQRIMAEVERVEPDLAEFALENLTAIYHRLLEVGAPAKQSRALYRQIESLVLTCIMAMRED
jgi:tRNA A37 N6-isopentenylltransferase MiaA